MTQQRVNRIVGLIGEPSPVQGSVEVATEVAVNLAIEQRLTLAEQMTLLEEWPYVDSPLTFTSSASHGPSLKLTCIVENLPLRVKDLDEMLRTLPQKAARLEIAHTGRRNAWRKAIGDLDDYLRER